MFRSMRDSRKRDDGTPVLLFGSGRIAYPAISNRYVAGTVFCKLPGNKPGIQVRI